MNWLPCKRDRRPRADPGGHCKDLDADTRDGSVAVSRSDAYFLQHPKDRDAVALPSDVSTVTALVQDWAAQHADDGPTGACPEQAPDARLAKRLTADVLRGALMIAPKPCG